jgi:hypothetical protein
VWVVGHGDSFRTSGHGSAPDAGIPGQVTYLPGQIIGFIAPLPPPRTGRVTPYSE